MIKSAHWWSWSCDLYAWLNYEMEKNKDIKLEFYLRGPSQSRPALLHSGLSLPVAGWLHISQ